MRTNLHDWMRVGIVQFMLYPDCISGSGPIPETTATIIDRNFFDFVELGPINDPAMRKETIALCQQARVEIAYDGQPLTLLPGLDLEAEDPASRQKAIDAMKRGIEEASEMGSTTCGVMSGKYYPRDMDVEAGLARLADSLKALCAFASPMGITLCLENFDQHPYSKDCLVGPTPMAAKLAETVKAETSNFGLLPDLSHTPIIPEEPRFMVESAYPHIARTQIGNGSNNPYSPYYGDDHPYFGADLTQVGIPQLTEFLQALVDVGFLNRETPGLVGFEIKPKSGEDPIAIMAGSQRALEQAWAEVSLPCPQVP